MTDPCRIAFEKWAKPMLYNLERLRDGEYVSSDTHQSFTGFRTAYTASHNVDLKRRELIARIEFLDATCRRELAVFGDWQMNHGEHFLELSRELMALEAPNE